MATVHVQDGSSSDNTEDSDQYGSNDEEDSSSETSLKNDVEDEDHDEEEDSGSEISLNDDAADEDHDDEEDSGSETSLKDDAADEDQSEKSGLANVMAKILSKSAPEKKSVILCRGKTDREIQKKKRSKGGEGQPKSNVSDSDESFSDDPEARKKTAMKRKMKKELGELARKKPDALDKEKERNLTKIATRGVVHVFNAVNQRQKQLEQQLGEAGSSERRRDKVLSSMTKKSFLDLLDQTKSNSLLTSKSKRAKRETSRTDTTCTEDSETWNILRDDYMMGAKMKDWDKADSDDEPSKSMDTRVSDSR